MFSYGIILYMNLEKLLMEALLEDKTYLEALDIVKKNSEGKIWLAGSGVYKNILNKLYGSNHAIKDYDFIVERIRKPIQIESDWTITESKHGNPKLKNNERMIDLISINNIHSVKERNLEPSIENYMSGVPLTIQSIAYDITDKKLLGAAGIESILDKTIGIQNQGEYDYSTSIYKEHYSVGRYARILGLKEI